MDSMQISKKIKNTVKQVIAWKQLKKKHNSDTLCLKPVDNDIRGLRERPFIL